MQAMVTGADIPPELFRRILFDVCEDADSLLSTVDEEVIIHFNPGIQVLKRKEALRNITACSLTCVYWASICRERLFEKVWIKHSEDMRAFSSLVASTPKRLQPIASHVFTVILLQRVGDRPWIHLLHMQPSLFSLRRDVRVYFHIEDSSGSDVRVTAIIPQRSTRQRLFAALPRTPPSSCLQCKGLTINNTHFVTPHILTSLLGSFAQWDSVELSHVTWDTGARFESNSDLLIRDALEVFPSFIAITVRRSKHPAETAWFAFVASQRRHSKQSVISLPSDYRELGGSESEPILRVLSSAQRCIIDICRSLCQGHEVPVLYLYHFVNIGYPILHKDVYLHNICYVTIMGYEPDEPSCGITMRFHGSWPVTVMDRRSNALVIDKISVLCAYISSSRQSSTAGALSAGAMQYIMAYPWEHIAELCAAQEGFMRLQLEFDCHDRLLQFMEARRINLEKLDGRIALFYRAEGEFEVHAADFETLVDLGNAYQYDYIYQ